MKHRPAHALLHAISTPKGLALLLWLVLWCCCTTAHAQAAAERTPAEDQIVRLTLPIDGEQVTGVLVRYSAITFTLATDEGERHRLLWNQIPADRVDRYWRYLEEPEGDAAKLFELGDILIRHSQGEDLAEQAFEQALALDAGLAEQVERSRAGLEPDGTPRFIGTADPQMWGELSDETMQAGIESLNAYCQRVQEEMGLQLSLYNSDRFMLLTDLQADELIGLPERLFEGYRATAELLGDDPDGNVFVGRCLIVLFRSRVEYVRFQQIMHETDARGTSGMCHAFGNGHVHIAAFQRGSERQTQHILVHEYVHAYLHRYRGPAPLADWIDEGLATHIAHQIIPPPGDTDLFLATRLLLEGQEGLGPGFFDNENLPASQYTTAGALTRYLLERGRHAYPMFIQAIKDGTPVSEALEEVYRMDQRILTRRFHQRLDRALNQRLGG